MILGKLPNIVTAETTFHSVNSRVLLQLVEQAHTSCRVLRFLVTKSAVVVNEEGAYVTQQEWEDSAIFRLVVDVTPIHENVLSPGVAMEVTEN